MSGRSPESLRRLLFDAFGLVRFQDFPLPLAEHGHQGVEAGPQSGDLAGIEPHGPRQLLVGQFAQVSVSQHVLEGAGNQVGRRLPRAGQILRIVFLVGVNHAADGLRDFIDDLPMRLRARIRSVACRPASTNSTQLARIAGVLEALISKAFSQAGGTRLSRSA